MPVEPLGSTTKGNRLHIGFYGRTNVGKSSFINYLAAQQVSITSPVPGTTTDIVEKAMEILPLGPVLLIDTAGLDDETILGRLRKERTIESLSRVDVAVLVVEADSWGDTEEWAVEAFRKKGIPYMVVVNKIDQKKPSDNFFELIKPYLYKLPKADSDRPESYAYMEASSLDHSRDDYRKKFKEILIKIAPDDFVNNPPLLADLLPAGSHVVFVVPIDLQAPKGRLILPQVQAIREALDADAMVSVVKERELPAFLERLKEKPRLIVCDSQVVNRVVADVPEGVLFTTFSILFARNKGDLIEYAKGAAHIVSLKPGDRVLIAEACTHHPIEDDIGRVKIPRWLRQYVGGDLVIENLGGRSWAKNLSIYDLVIHCGGCMLNRRAMLNRISEAREAGVPITNYGVAISFLQGVLEKALSPFPSAYLAFKKELEKIKTKA